MTKFSQLEEAIEYRERLKDLWCFKSGLEDHGENRPAWGGLVNVSFGGYAASISMGSTRTEFMAAIDAEEKMLLDTLQLMGVEIDGT